LKALRTKGGWSIPRCSVNPKTNTWVAKGPKSSFYPDNWSQGKVLSEIEGAFAKRIPTPGKPANYWEGVSPSGVRIGGYTDAAGDINTAFPIF